MPRLSNGAVARVGLRGRGLLPQRILLGRRQHLLQALEVGNRRPGADFSAETECAAIGGIDLPIRRRNPIIRTVHLESALIEERRGGRGGARRDHVRPGGLGQDIHEFLLHLGRWRLVAADEKVDDARVAAQLQALRAQGRAGNRMIGGRPRRPLLPMIAAVPAEDDDNARLVEEVVQLVPHQLALQRDRVQPEVIDVLHRRARLRPVGPQQHVGVQRATAINIGLPLILNSLPPAGVSSIPPVGCRSAGCACRSLRRRPPPSTRRSCRAGAPYPRPPQGRMDRD